MSRTDLLYYSQVDEPGKGWWKSFSPLSFSMAAVVPALLIGIFVGYLGFRSNDKASEAFAYPLYAQARGVETIVSPASNAKFYTLYLYPTWTQGYTHLRAQLREISGAEKFSVAVNANAAGDAIHVIVPARKLADGKYILVMLGKNGARETELARFPFTLRLE
jgi:hypothetical protein